MQKHRLAAVMAARSPAAFKLPVLASWEGREACWHGAACSAGLLPVQGASGSLCGASHGSLVLGRLEAASWTSWLVRLCCGMLMRALLHALLLVISLPVFVWFLK